MQGFVDQIELGSQIIIWSTGGSVTDLYSVTAWHRVTWNLAFAIMWLKRFRFCYSEINLSLCGWYLSMWNLKILWILRNQRLTPCKALPSLTTGRPSGWSWRGMPAQRSLWLIRLLHDNDRTSSLQQRPVSCLHHHKWTETGFILAPVLFNLFFMCMLAHAVQNMEEGVYVVVQFYPWFKFYFPLFWCMVMYDKEFETK